MDEPVTVRLEATPLAIGRARTIVDRFEGTLSPRARDDARLLVSELVTNSLRHGSLEGGDGIRVAMSFRGDVFRVEVADRGTGFVPDLRAPPRSSDESGWGLFLVARIADRWGVRDDAGETVVWFELDGGSGRHGARTRGRQEDDFGGLSPPTTG